MILNQRLSAFAPFAFSVFLTACGVPPTTAPSALKSDGFPTPAGRDFKSLMLFFNFVPGTPASELPAAYAYTSVNDALAFIDEGASPATMKVTDYVYNYWNRVSSGNVKVRVDALRNAAGTPIVQTVDMPRDAAGNAQPLEWGSILDATIIDNAELAWREAGSFVNPATGHREIPSVIIIQNYNNNGASASLYGHTVTAYDGTLYDIGDIIHLQYSLAWDTVNPALPAFAARAYWRILIHELGHNFLEFADLYGPNGAAGYYDLLGDYSYAGETSEVSSYFKARLGWTLPQEINGPTVAARDLELAPYTTTGQSFKVVPNPEVDPEEYFFLEFRTSTGREIWRPDGGLTESGLFVTRMNEHALADGKDGVTNSNKHHDAAFFQPVFADFSDGGGGTWTTRKDSGAVFPYIKPTGEMLNALSDSGNPSLRLAGGLPSGISITNIRVEGGHVKFRLSIANTETLAWEVRAGDRCVGGRFLPDHAALGGQMFCMRDGAGVLLQQADNKLFVRQLFGRRLGGWNLGPDDQLVTGDLDGDGLDDVLIRSPGWIGVLGWKSGEFTAKSVLSGRIGEWALGGSDRHLIADFRGDGTAQVVFRAPNWLGLYRFTGTDWEQLGPLASPNVDSWTLAATDTMTAGKITNSEHANLIVSNTDALAVLEWQDANRRFLVRSDQRDALPGLANDNPAIGTPDAVFAGRFGAGSALDSVVLRVGHRLVHAFWSGGLLRASVEQNGLVPDAPGSTTGAVLTDDMAVYAGRFRIDQHALLVHLTDGTIWHVEWFPNTFVAHQVSADPFGSNWRPNDGTPNLVIADLDRYGGNRDAPGDVAPDHIDDIFVLKPGFAGVFGINHLRGADGAADTLEAFRMWTSGGAFAGAGPVVF